MQDELRGGGEQESEPKSEDDPWLAEVEQMRRLALGCSTEVIKKKMYLGYLIVGGGGEP